MYSKISKTNIYSFCTKILVLYLIVIVNLSCIGTDLYLNESPNQVLRPPSYQNGKGKPDNFYPPTTTPSHTKTFVPPQGPGFKYEEGGVTKTFAFEGIVGFSEVDKKDGEAVGPEVPVPAGTFVTSLEPTKVRPLSKTRIDSTPAEFGGTPLDFAEGLLKASHILSLEKGASFKEFPRDRNKVIEFNTDLFPDFDLEVDSPERRLVEGVLTTVAHKMLRYERDVRFSRRVYIDFVSRDSTDEGKDTRSKVIELFKGLPLVRQHHLERLLFPVVVESIDRLTITHKEDLATFQNPALILDEKAMADGKIMAYPWAAIMDLSIGILSIDRRMPPGEQIEAYNAIKGIFENLLIPKEDDEIREELLSRLDDILQRLLSDNRQEYINAALELALPPVQKLDLKAVDELNRIMIEVARYA